MNAKHVVLACLLTVIAPQAFAAFSENWSRYPAPDQILEKFRRDFPLARLEDLPEDCVKLTAENRAALGDSDPAAGRPVIDRPNSSFVNWYTRCAAEFILRDQEQRTPDNRLWNDLTPAAKDEFVIQFIARLIGPEDVLIDLGIAASQAELADKIEREIEVEADGDIGLTHAAKMVSFLIELLDTLKY